MYITTWFLTLSTNCRVRLTTLLSISTTWGKGQFRTFSVVSDDDHYEGTIVMMMMMMMLMTTRNLLGPWWGHRCKWDPSKSLEGGRSCPRVHLNFQVSVFGSEKRTACSSTNAFGPAAHDSDQTCKKISICAKISAALPNHLHLQLLCSSLLGFGFLKFFFKKKINWSLVVLSIWWSLKD